MMLLAKFDTNEVSIFSFKKIWFYQQGIHSNVSL